VETNLASTDYELMNRYAHLVDEADVRERIFGLIADEWTRTTRSLDAIFGGELEARRPRMMKTLQVRAQALRVLHEQQLELLQKWRELGVSNEQHAANELLPELLLSINAIASGLRTTG
jgi:phosphoenolpyruvate carboxylase